MNRNKRLDELRKVPQYAAVDHRFFLDENGRDGRISGLPRKICQQIKAEGIKISKKYSQILTYISRSGVGYPVDQFLRDLAVEYTHRYAASGTMNQPTSFNYFESFCNIRLIVDSFAPYAEPADEINHLFNVADYFDYLTVEETPAFDISTLQEVPEGLVHHFTQNGSINDFTYLTSEGREFVISGFSMVRHRGSLHWYLIGGEVLSESEWQHRSKNDMEIESKHVAAEKRPFLADSMRERGNRGGAPIPLQGTKTAVRTIISGETDLITYKHVARCYMTESENIFELFCDDPDVFSRIHDRKLREEIITQMQERVESAAVMWNLADGFFQLPRYFQFRVTVPFSVVKASQRPAPRTAKGGRGLGANFKHVTSIEISDTRPCVVRSYTSPRFEIETEGYWRRLPPDGQGHDREGNQIQGRTWVKASNKWRQRADQPRTVYIKSSVAAAKIQVSEYLAAAQLSDGDSHLEGQKIGVLYVMRCVAMKDEVYKVGWTAGDAEQRARELSSATGVPESFAVVAVWQHPDPEALEKGVHAMLSPYRLNEGREFFNLKYHELKAIIEREVVRSEHRSN